MIINLQTTYFKRKRLIGDELVPRYRVSFADGADWRESPWYATRRRALHWAADYCTDD